MTNYIHINGMVIGPVNKEEPNENNHKTKIGQGLYRTDYDAFRYANKVWKDYLDSLPSYPVHPSLKLKEGKVIEGVDFVLKKVKYFTTKSSTDIGCAECCNGDCDCEGSEKCTFKGIRGKTNGHKCIFCKGECFYKSLDGVPTCAFPVPVQPAEAGKGEELTVEDYQEVFEDHKRLVKELDVIINGENAAKQASLCDIVAHLSKEKSTPASQQFTKEEMVGFAEWINLQDVSQNNSGQWVKNNPAFREKAFAETTPDLLNLYLEPIKKQ